MEHVALHIIEISRLGNESKILKIQFRPRESGKGWDKLFIGFMCNSFYSKRVLALTNVFPVKGSGGEYLLLYDSKESTGNYSIPLQPRHFTGNDFRINAVGGVIWGSVWSFVAVIKYSHWFPRSYKVNFPSSVSVLLYERVLFVLAGLRTNTSYVSVVGRLAGVPRETFSRLCYSWDIFIAWLHPTQRSWISVSFLEVVTHFPHWCNGIAKRFLADKGETIASLSLKVIQLAAGRAMGASLFQWTL
ncbi:hypothetical protein IEQ34_023208 [Dendrobium chrysotoxum]|uniref:Uncharacterized protein n=1 Tax=Dendrobium chrysotoxum TaxID=161865 RepID=A0AAV7FV81_DENCH|nr:hypothetical protein IEQ34_023208 [Dendrobium chrysotoxum]